MHFQHPHHKNLKKNPYGLLYVRPESIINSIYGPVYDAGLELRGAVPLNDPWPGIKRSKLWKWDQKNIEFMLNGQPPYGIDHKKVQLHHRNNQPNGPVDEYLFSEHNTQHGLFHDPDSALIELAVGNFPTRPDYDRQVWSKQRARYWVTRAWERLNIK